MKLIDLGLPHGCHSKLAQNLPIYCGEECYAYDLEISSHSGSYIETEAHLYRNTRNVGDLPLEELVNREAAIIRLPERGQRMITAEELEANRGEVEIRPGDALLIQTGWDQQNQNLKPYFSRDSVTWMLDQEVTMMGADTFAYDNGFINPTGMFVEMFEHKMIMIGPLTNLAAVSQDRVKLWIMPLKIDDICTLPCRIIAIED